MRRLKIQFATKHWSISAVAVNLHGITVHGAGDTAVYSRAAFTIGCVHDIAGN